MSDRFTGFDKPPHFAYNARTVALDGALAIPCSQHSLYWC